MIYNRILLIIRIFEEMNLNYKQKVIIYIQL